MQPPRLLAAGLALACLLLGPTAARAQTDVVIAAAGDIACDPESDFFNDGNGTSRNCRQKHTSNLLVDQRNSSAGLAGVLAIGDVQYENGALSKFQVSYDPSWGRLKDITYPAIGNHEYFTEAGSGYFDYFNGIGKSTGPAGDRDEGYYSVDVGGWHIVTLNSMCDRVGGCHDGSPQEVWLEQDLAANTASCTLAQAHHPYYNSGPSGVYTFMQDFWKTLYADGAEIVLGGHAHTYEQFSPQDAYENLDLDYGIRHFIVGTGGKNLNSPTDVLRPNSEVRDNSHFGVLKLTLRANSYDWAFVNILGETVYSGTQACHAAPPTDSTPPADTTPPETTITSGPPGRTKETTATFTFESSEGQSTFKCRIDGVPAAYEDCVSPKTYTSLGVGDHKFEVFAVDTASNADPTAAVWNWKVARGKGT